MNSLISLISPLPDYKIQPLRQWVTQPLTVKHLTEMMAVTEAVSQPPGRHS